MKKFIFILGLFLMFYGNSFAAELVNIEENVFTNYEKVFAKSIKDNTDLKGNVEVYMDYSESGRLNYYKILNYDNAQLAKNLDKFLKSVEKPAPKFYKSYKFIIVLSNDDNVEIFVKSKDNHYKLREKNYFSKVNMKINDYLPVEDYIDLAMVSAELTISAEGEVKSVRIIESSGDNFYDDELLKYLKSLSFGNPPSDILKRDEVSLIVYVNPSSADAIEEYQRYYRQVSSEIDKQIRIYNPIVYPIYFQFDKDGNVADVKMYKRYEQINPSLIMNELKKIKVSPYEGKTAGNNLEIVYLGGKSIRGLQKYYKEKMYPEILKIVPEVTSFKLKPVKLLILMSKDGQIEEVELMQSSGSEEFDKKTVEALKGTWFDAFENRSTDKFIFQIELFNLNKSLYEHYTKYVRTVSSYSIANLPLSNVKTDKIYFIISKAGKIKGYQLYDCYDNVINEKRVEDKIKRLTFPRFSRMVDAEELHVLIDLHNPGKQLYSNSKLNSMTLGTAIMYKSAR